MTKESTGALIMAKNTKRYLFVLRNGARFEGTWALVGGKVEKNERTIDALKREIYEEINLSFDIETNKIIPIETFTSNDTSFLYHTFLILVDEEFIPTLNNEHRGYCWVSIEDYPKPLHPGLWKTFNFQSVIDKIKTVEKLI